MDWSRPIFSLFNLTIMHFLFLHPFKRNLREEQALVSVQEPPRNTSEGSEFLDDAIRMEDMQVMATEECVAAGSPKILL